MKYWLLSILIITGGNQLRAQSQQPYLLVGTYTNGKSEGIYVYRFNSKDGNAVYVSHIKSSNPSFLAVSPSRKFVYAVNEDADSINRKGGGVSAYSFDKKAGQLTLLNNQPSEGQHPCYVSIDKTGRWVLAGNYNSGNFSVLPATTNGQLGKAATVVAHTGSGPNTARQKAPHVHGVFLQPDNKTLLVPDLGTDKVKLYRLNTAKGSVSSHHVQEAIHTTPGSGPRHLAVHPNGRFLYVLLELSGSIAVYNYPGKDSARLLQELSAQPLTYKGSVSGADIHLSPDGKFLYSSNRGGVNDIAIFSVNVKTGLLTPAGRQSTLGLKPRNFNFDPTGKFLLVANQESNDVVVFRRNAATGLLTDTGHRIAVGNPACLRWIW